MFRLAQNIQKQFYKKFLRFQFGIHERVINIKVLKSMQSTLHPGLAYKEGRDQLSTMYMIIDHALGVFFMQSKRWDLYLSLGLFMMFIKKMLFP